MYSFQDMMLSASVAVYIAVSLVVAYVRWGHRCEPYARKMDYYYPAWRAIIFCFLTNLVFLPVVFSPSDTDAFLLLRMFLVLGSPFFCARLMFSYFGKVLKKNWWRKPVYAFSITFTIMVSIVTILAIIPGTQIEGSRLVWIMSTIGILAIIYMLCFIMAVTMTSRAVRRFSEENYSNVSDFPRNYAKSILRITILHVAVSWTATIIGTPAVISISVLILSALVVVFIVSALSPHRMMDIEQVEKVEAPQEPVVEAPEPVEIMPVEKKEEILKLIRYQVETQKAYLDSHLTLISLARSCGVNRTYLSQVMGEYLGGFFAYVNRCRLAHAARYRVEHPAASIEEMAEASGFGTRQSFYNARRHLSE